MGLFKSSDKTAGRLDTDRLPRHIAIIMDGNGRWAKKRGLPRTAGHAVGAETFRKVATHCKELGVEYEDFAEAESAIRGMVYVFNWVGALIAAGLAGGVFWRIKTLKH